MSAASVRAPAEFVPPPRARERFRSTWVDRFLGSDPGLNRFRLALQSVVSIGVILEAELLFVRFTHALQVQAHGAALPAAEAAGANHGTLVVAMLLGAIVGMNVSFGVTDPTARGQLVTMLFFPIPLVAALAFGIAIGGHRFLALASLERAREAQAERWTGRFSDLLDEDPGAEALSCPAFSGQPLRSLRATPYRRENSGWYRP